MGLFGKKKKEKREEIPDFAGEISKVNLLKTFPNLPELPKFEEKKGFPRYQSEIGAIKQEVGGITAEPQVEGVEIPIRKPRTGAPQLRMPNLTALRPQTPSRGRVSSGKPIFIKINRYREAIDNLDNIKELCRNADNLLGEINRLREEENRELEKWRSDIIKIKDKLLLVDKKLFEG